jgi:predicted transposase YbfD/YdcC
VVKHFDEQCFRVGAPSRADCDAFDDTHGRLVRRRVFASTEAASLDALSGWPGLRTVLAVESIRSVNSVPTKVESEIRYLLTSCPDDPATLGKATRSHWAVENALHWVLDVTFREDDSRVRDRTAARNLALLRKIALNIVGRDRTSKASVRARRKKAAWNDSYMLKLLAG